MKALLLSEYNRLSLTEQPRPEPAPDELLIQVAACGICGSDVHGFDGSTGRRIPPIVMGHEAAGIVTSVGTNVRDFAPGDRVTFDSTVYCGACSFCLRGEINLCDRRQVLGVSCGEYRRAGAFAEFIAVPARIAYHLPDTFSFADAAMLEAVSVALHGVAVSQMAAEDSVLVIGAGMIGLLLLQAARVSGASRIFVADVDATRLKLAADLGADCTIQATGAALIDEVLRLTRRPRRRCRPRSRRAQRNHRQRNRLRPQRRHRNPHRQHQPAGHVAAAKSRLAPDPPAGIVCLRRRISAGHRADRQRKNQGQAAHHRHRAAQRWPVLVPPAPRARAQPDEDRPRSQNRHMDTAPASVERPR